MNGLASATEVARRIKTDIRENTGLTASAGVSYNKFLAKLASDYRKPDGLFVIKPAAGPRFVETLLVGQFHGVGRVTAQKMNELGIVTGLDLRSQSMEFLQRHFGKVGQHYYHIARGIDHRPVNPNRIRKSVGSESTFERDLFEYDDLLSELQPLINDVWGYCTDKEIRGRTVTLKVKFADFRQITRSRTLLLAVDSRETIARVVGELLQPILPATQDIRLLGVSLSGLGNVGPVPGGQLSLFDR